MRAEISCMPARKAAARPVGPPPIMVRSLISINRFFRTVAGKRRAGWPGSSLVSFTFADHLVPLSPPILLTLDILRGFEYLKLFLDIGTQNIGSRHHAHQLAVRHH